MIKRTTSWVRICYAPLTNKSVRCNMTLRCLKCRFSKMSDPWLAPICTQNHLFQSRLTSKFAKDFPSTNIYFHNLWSNIRSVVATKFLETSRLDKIWWLQDSKKVRAVKMHGSQKLWIKLLSGNVDYQRYRIELNSRIWIFWKIKGLRNKL